MKKDPYAKLKAAHADLLSGEVSVLAGKNGVFVRGLSVWENSDARVRRRNALSFAS